MPPHSATTDSLDHLLELRPFPAAASRLMSACDSEGVTAREIADIIRYDPALSLRVLRIANSPLYGFSGEIRTIDHATVVLGLRTVREVALSLAVGEVFGSGAQSTARARRILWSHSLASGCFASVLAERTQRCSPDEAFLAGMVHDVGKLLLFDYHPGHYSTVSEETLSSGADIERDMFGIDHTTLGHRYGEHWELPDDINEAICFHHEPQDAGFAEDLVEIAWAANELAHVWQADADCAEGNVAEILQQIELPLSAEETEQLKRTAQNAFCNAQEACSQ